jgi:nucleotide-binding universal stress UspA family protein
MTAPGTRIVVGLDHSPAARSALAYALREAVRRDVPVEVVTAAETPVDWGAVHGARPDPAMWPSPEQVRAEAATRAARVVDEVRAELAEDVDIPPIVTVTAVLGPAAPALLRAARGAALLVVGSRGRGTVASTMLGSVSRECVLHATGPVTVVPAVDDRRPAPVAP